MAYKPPGVLRFDPDNSLQTLGGFQSHANVKSHTVQNAFRWTNLLSLCPPFHLTYSTPLLLACLSGAKGKVSKRTAIFWWEREKLRQKKREGEEEGKAISPVHEQTRGGQFGAFSHRCACS